MSEPDDQQLPEPSKTQRKRDMAELRALGEQLAGLSPQDLEELADERLRVAALEYRRIRKGNAKKRQLQFIGKLLRSADIDAVRSLIERKDASKLAHKTAFHQLERWRTLLMEDFGAGVSAIADVYPAVDRQQLRTLTRQAVREVEQGSEDRRHYRRLFQFLRELAESAESTESTDQSAGNTGAG